MMSSSCFAQGSSYIEGIYIIIIQMSCHSSCGTCLGTAFNNCLACAFGTDLVNGACFCPTEWDPSCTYSINLRGFYIGLQSFYMILFPLVIFLYFLKVRLPYSYRIVTGLQSISLLIFSNRIYFYFQNQFGLRLLAKSNGYYNFINRLEGLSISHAVASFVLFGCYLVVYLFGWNLTQTFRKQYEEYSDYLMDNFMHFMNCFYFFGSKAMFYFIGAWVSATTTTISSLAPFGIFSIIIVVVLIKLFYDFHKGQLQKDEVYEPELLLYSMLSSSSMVGLPMIENPTFYITIYLVPLGLLILVMLLNKNYEIFTKPKSLFYLTEGFVAGFAVTFILMSEPYRSYSLLAAISIGTAAIVIEMIYVYYGGADLSRSNKVHPESKLENASEESIKYKKAKKSGNTGSVSKGSYF